MNKLYCTCKKCGNKKAEVDVSKITVACPPEYDYTCNKCDNVGKILCKEAYGEGDAK